MSMPSFFGRSRTWPFEAITSYPEPRYFLMVLAFAGDSTTTSVLLIGTRTFTALLGRPQGPRNPEADEPTHKHKPFQIVTSKMRPQGSETTTPSRVRVKINAWRRGTGTDRISVISWSQRGPVSSKWSTASR